MRKYDRVTAKFAIGLQDHTWIEATKVLSIEEEWFPDELLERSGIQDVLNMRREVVYVLLISHEWEEITEIEATPEWNRYFKDYIGLKEED